MDNGGNNLRMKNNCVITFLLLFLTACSHVVSAPPSLLAREFPSVSGGALTGDKVQIPEQYKGAVTVLLIGYLQKAQFDIDRWILGLLQAEVSVKIVEIPTIAGMMPQMVQSFIDNGMRKGIPREDWASVVTVYEDSSKIIDAIGNESPQNAHVVLLDRSGKIRWFSNRGYSAAQILELKSLVASL